jgi:hypothetical protein
MMEAAVSDDGVANVGAVEKDHRDTLDADTVVVVLDYYYYHVNDDDRVVDSANAVVVLREDRNSVRRTRGDTDVASFRAVVVVVARSRDCDRDRTVVDKNVDRTPYLDYCDETLEVVVVLDHNQEAVVDKEVHYDAAALGLEEEEDKHHHHLHQATCCCCWVDVVHRDTRVAVLLLLSEHVHHSRDPHPLREATVAPIHVPHYYSWSRPWRQRQPPRRPMTSFHPPLPWPDYCFPKCDCQPPVTDCVLRVDSWCVEVHHLPVPVMDCPWNSSFLECRDCCCYCCCCFHHHCFRFGVWRNPSAMKEGPRNH